MSRGLFITSSGTDVGKTLAACALAAQLRRAGRRLRVLKPVVSGFSRSDAANADTGLLLTAAEVGIDDDSIAAASPWRFSHAMAPNMAARREGRTIDFERVVAFCREAADDGAYTLIEGVGGVMAPVDDHHTVLDWIAEVELPALLVTGSYLGAISHGLTAAAALRGRGIALAGVVINESETSPAPLEETVGCLKAFLPGVAIRTIPRLKPASRLWEGVPDLTALAAQC